MKDVDLATLYQRYLDCLNARDWTRLGEYVDDDVIHNGRTLGVAGYRGMLEQDVRDIPDLQFVATLVLAEGITVGARLLFDCSPCGTFLGMPVNGRRLVFAENVFYVYRGDRIAEVFSVIDKPAIERQLLTNV